MGAKLFSFKTMTWMNLGERAANFTFKLASLFTIVIVKILSWSGTYPADRAFRDFGFRPSWINRF
jgi:hypothetical protein